MVRTPLTEAERTRGVALGRVLQRARDGRSAAGVALRAGISLDTLRKIERGAIAAPTFFTVAALARALELDLTALAAAVTDEVNRTRIGSEDELHRSGEPGRSAGGPGTVRADHHQAVGRPDGQQRVPAAVPPYR